jgi:hypothetical protein
MAIVAGRPEPSRGDRRPREGILRGDSPSLTGSSAYFGFASLPSSLVFFFFDR